jgi:divalent metal cation (Fe/Co/Zn/Cd) transporter
MEKRSSAVNALRIVYFALLIGMLLFSGVSFFISRISDPLIPEEETQNTILIICLVVGTICTTVAGSLFRKDVMKLKAMNTIQQKFDGYKRISIRTYALYEGPALFAIICFYLTHNIRMLIVVALIILGYLSFRPFSVKIASQIGERKEDVENL